MTSFPRADLIGFLFQKSVFVARRGLLFIIAADSGEPVGFSAFTVAPPVDLWQSGERALLYVVHQVALVKISNRLRRPLKCEHL